MPASAAKGDAGADIDGMQGFGNEAEAASLEAFEETIGSLWTPVLGQPLAGSAASLPLKSGNDFTVSPSVVSPNLSSALSGGISTEASTNAAPYLPVASVPASKPIVDPIASSPGLANSSSTAGSTPNGGIPAPTTAPSGGGAAGAGSPATATGFAGTASAAPVMAADTSSDLTISSLSLNSDTDTPGDNITNNAGIVGSVGVSNNPRLMWTGMSVTVNGMTTTTDTSPFQPNMSGSFVYVPTGITTGPVTVSLTPIGYLMPDPSDTMSMGGTVTGNTSSISFVYDAKPQASGGSFQVVHDQATLQSVSIQDDNSSDTLTASVVSSPAHGTVSFGTQSWGSPSISQGLTYTPSAGWTGTDSFTYHVYDGYEYSDVATVTETVIDNAPTVSSSLTYSVQHDQTLTMGAGSLLVGASDLDNDPMTVSLVANASHGTAIVNPDGSFTYTPNANWAGQDQFTYKVSDGIKDSSVMTASISVNDNAPIVVTQSAATITDVGVQISLLAGDTDPDGDNMTVIDPVAANGTLSLDPQGNGVYTPNDGFTGTDTITYKVSDGPKSLPAIASILVTAMLCTVNTADDQDEGATDEQDTEDAGAGPQSPADDSKAAITDLEVLFAIPWEVDPAKLVVGAYPVSLMDLTGNNLIKGGADGTVWQSIFNAADRQKTWIVPVTPTTNGVGGFTLQEQVKVNTKVVPLGDFNSNVVKLQGVDAANAAIQPILTGGVNLVVSQVFDPIQTKLEALWDPDNPGAWNDTIEQADALLSVEKANVAAALTSAITDAVGTPVSKLFATADSKLAAFDSLVSQSFVVFQSQGNGYTTNVTCQITPISTESIVSELAVGALAAALGDTQALNDVVTSLAATSLASVNVGASVTLGNITITGNISMNGPSLSDLESGKFRVPFIAGVTASTPSGYKLTLGTNAGSPGSIGGTLITPPPAAVIRDFFELWKH